MSFPQQFGRFVLKELKARGGMAEIFDAEMVGTEGFSKRVALKRMLPHLSEDKSFTAMFLDEARLASKLSHPNVVQVFDFGEVEGRYFIAMEYLEGESLSTLVRSARRSGVPLSQRAVLQIMAAAADGLHHAHTFAENGKPLQVVHRDISPSNIMVTLQGGVKVLDFGIARAADRQQDATETGIVKGKVPYCSPEQLRGDTLDARSDVFSLGIVLYELLVGTWLFRREKQLDTVMAVLNAPVPPPSSVRAELDPRIDAVVARALERDVKLRTQSALELRRELEALMNGPPVRLDEFMSRVLSATPQHETATPVASEGNISIDVATSTVAPPKPPAPAPTAPPPAKGRSPLEKAVLATGLVAVLVAVGVVLRVLNPSVDPKAATPDAGVVLSALNPTVDPKVATPDAGVVLGALNPSVDPKVAMPDAGAAVAVSPTLQDDAALAPQPDAGPVAIAELDAGLVAPPPRVVVKPVGKPKDAKKPNPVPVRLGLLDVSCAPWCRILIDGKDVGHVSPLVAFEVSAGKHTLRVEHPPSGHTSEKQLVVESGARLKETFNLR
jgi:serine/threonine protein kinase